MANEIIHAYDTGSTFYARVFLAKTVWNTSEADFETWDDDNVGDYDIALTDLSSGMYIGDFPSCDAGRYKVNIYKQAGASPATTDEVRGTGEILWDGVAEIYPADEDDILNVFNIYDEA